MHHLLKCLFAELGHSHEHKDVLFPGLHHGGPLLPHAFHDIVRTEHLRDVLGREGGVSVCVGGGGGGVMKKSPTHKILRKTLNSKIFGPPYNTLTNSSIRIYLKTFPCMHMMVLKL